MLELNDDFKIVNLPFQKHRISFNLFGLTPIFPKKSLNILDKCLKLLSYELISSYFM
jgi:hypothetical protein